MSKIHLGFPERSETPLAPYWTMIEEPTPKLPALPRIFSSEADTLVDRLQPWYLSLQSTRYLMGYKVQRNIQFHSVLIKTNCA